MSGAVSVRIHGSLNLKSSAPPQQHIGEDLTVYVRITYMENVKKDAPMVGLIERGSILPTCLMIRDVLPTPTKRKILNIEWM